MNTPDTGVTAAAIDRATFPYSSLPRAAFEASEVPMRPAPDRFVTDTTFRDGQQARSPFSANQVLRLFDLLHQLDGEGGVIRQSEFFLYSGQERAIVARCRERGYRYPEVTGWIRARAEDLAIVRELGIAETGMLTSVSDVHIYRKLGLDRRGALDGYLRVVDAALEAGIRPRCHFEDVTRADVPGFVLPFARALMERSRQAGVPIRIRLCDTMGVALPWPAAALPRGVPRLIRAMTDEAGVPPAWLEWHGHNDFAKAHANAVTAWLYGCAAINCTLLGMGERCGNSPLEAALVEHIGLSGENCLQLPALVEMGRYLREECDTPIPANYPLLGEEAFSTRAGVHIDGLLKDAETYMSFDPQRVLGRPIKVVVSDRSGVAGIVWWLNAHRSAEAAAPLQKSDPRVQAVYRDLQARYASGRCDDPSEAELAALAEAHLPGYIC